jgi:hypothetical protein
MASALAEALAQPTRKMCDTRPHRAAKVREPSTCRCHRIAVGLALGLLGALPAGCSPGIRWHGLVFEPVYADARRDQKLTFVYFRHWAVIACTDFEENVLKDPEVLEALRPDGSFYCAVLDSYADRRLARDCGVEGPPAVAILDPDGRVLARLSGKITVEQLLAAIRTALQAYPAASRPARAP